MSTASSCRLADPLSRTARPSIADLAAAAGTSVPCAGNLPVALDDPGFAWFVDEGKVDLFLNESCSGKEQSAPQHLLRAGSGRLLPGVAPDKGETTLGLIAKGLPGTVLKRVPASRLAEVAPEELAEEMDIWLTGLSDAPSRYVAHRPRTDALVEPGTAPSSVQGVLSVRHGVAWVSVPGRRAGLFMDLIDCAEFDAEGGAGAVPLTPASWITLSEAMPLSVRHSRTLAEEGTLLPAVASFHGVAFALERLNRRLAVVDQANLERASATSRRSDEESARRRLFNLYDIRLDQDAVENDAALAEAMRAIGSRQGIAFDFPTRSGVSDKSPIGLDDILDVSGVRARQVRLRPEEKWWLSDSSPMLAYREEDGRPVALLPGKFGRYREFDPVRKKSVRVSEERAATLKPEAWQFYRPLPSKGIEPDRPFPDCRTWIGPGPGARGAGRTAGWPAHAGAGAGARFRRGPGWIEAATPGRSTR